jgi:pimeloyl-ACP methyl ester carboxylesterase
MPDETMLVTDHTIHTAEGALFARAWQPDGAEAGAPTILLFHDSLGSVELWRDFPKALATATGLRVLAYDRLGFGRSAPHPGRLSPDFTTQEARTSVPALRAQLGLDGFVAFGHSVGGAMAVATGAAFPDACAAVVTESAQAFVEDRTLAGIREAQAQFADPRQVERLARYHGDKARWVLDAWIETWLAPSFAGWTLDATLAQLRCPVLVMHGSRDEFGSRAHPERIAALAGGPATMTIFEGGGHVPHRENPEAVLESVTRFLATHRLCRGGR